MTVKDVSESESVRVGADGQYILNVQWNEMRKSAQPAAVNHVYELTCTIIIQVGVVFRALIRF